ncbi:MAG: LacI family DNA-binding transcriptional regulator [Actinotalea sp.]|nr:LacI family DNA-binding transcriptional regulator [Actinotalea sp.]
MPDRATPRSRKVTVRDVAAEAGVSIATASRALAGQASVDPELVRRVLRASADLGYRANALARALRTQRTDTIGMVVPSISNPYFIAAIEAVELVLAESDRSLLLCDAREDATVEAGRIDLLVHRMVDGLIVVPVATEASAPALEAAAQELPVVQFDRFVDAVPTDFVGSDNTVGVRACVDHLRRRGARRIAFVGAQPTTSTAAERLRAFRDCVGVEDCPDRWLLLGDFSARWGREAARSLLEGEGLPDAIVCGADVIAVALVAELRSAGVTVPEQVAIVSYDDSTLGALTVPPLTSVRQPIEDMAREAVRLLDHRRERADAAVRKSVFPPALVVRGSTR